MNQSNLLPWQIGQRRQLHRYLQQQRIPQALLFAGKPGLGKRQLAGHFISSLLCKQIDADGNACGNCHDCRLLKADTHPDLITVTPAEDKTAISVDQIRNLIAQLNLKPQFDGYRLVLINPADSMNTNAANAFLKCLEEPAERTVILLVASNPSKLPATIISRCQKLLFPVPDETIACTWLNQQCPQLLPQQIKPLLHLANGAPLLALQEANSGTLELRNNCFNTWLALAKQREHPVLVAENWQKLPEAPLLSWISTWLIDLIKCRYHAQADTLYNPDFHKDLAELSQAIDLKKTYTLYDTLSANRRLLHTTINKQLMFEEILIQWAQLNQNM